VGPFLARFGFPADQRVEQIPKGIRWRLAQALTAWPIPVSGPRSFEFAEVTLGGIETGEVDARTLESRLVPGLHFAGEMLDIHGDLGGYNFQWAWSSGFLAGREAGGG
jgi:predicted flavoprotein YhiN